MSVSIEPAYRQVSSGERVELDCSAYGSPQPSYAWSRAGGVPLGPRVRLATLIDGYIQKKRLATGYTHR